MPSLRPTTSEVPGSMLSIRPLGAFQTAATSVTRVLKFTAGDRSRKGNTGAFKPCATDEKQPASVRSSRLDARVLFTLYGQILRTKDAPLLLLTTKGVKSSGSGSSGRPSRSRNTSFLFLTWSFPLGSQNLSSENGTVKRIASKPRSSQLCPLW